MEESIRVDADALADDIEKRAKESGLVVTACMPTVHEEDFVNGNDFMPVISVVGNTNATTSAFMVKALRHVAEQLEQDEDVAFMVKELERLTSSRVIKVENTRGDNND